MKKIYLFAVYALLSVFLTFGLQEAGSLLDVGIEEYKKGQYSFAINNLRKYIQIADDSHNKARAYYYISLCYYFDGEYLTALKYLNELSAKFRLSEFSSQTHFWRGLIYQNLEEWENAEESFLTYVSFIKTADLTPRAYLAAANSQIELKKYERAQKSLLNIITGFEKSDKFEEASVLYFYVLIQTGGYKDEKAAAFIRSWLDRLGDTGKDYRYKDRFWLYGAETALQEKEYHYAKSLLKKIDNYAQGSPSSDIALLRLYEIEQKLGNLLEAREYLIRLANEYPGSKYALDASLSMGILEYRNAGYEDALVFFKQTLRSIETMEQDGISDPDEQLRLDSLKIKTLFYQAETSYQTGKKEQAARLFKSVMDEKSVLETQALLRLMAICLEQEKSAELASLIKTYDKQITAGPAGMDEKKQKIKDRYLLYRAKYYYQIEDFKSASRSLEAIEDIRGFGSSASNLRAKILIKEQKTSEALALLDRTVNTAPLDQKPYIAYEIMTLLFSMKEYKKALEYQDFIITYSKHLEEDQKLALIIKTRYLGGISCLSTRHYDEGIKLLKELLLFSGNTGVTGELEELITNSYYYLGWMYYKTSSYDLAAKHFGTASLLIKEGPLASDAAYMEAWSYFSNKNFKNAAGKFQAIYDKHAPRAVAYKAFYKMAKCYENMAGQKNKDKAESLYRQLYYELSENSYQDEALFEIIKRAFDGENLETANNLVREFKGKYPGSPLYERTLLMEAEAFLAAERYSEALSSYKYYIGTFPASGTVDRALYWAGYSAVRTKDYETAVEVLTRLQQEFGESAFYLNALFLLADVYRLTADYGNEQKLLRELITQKIQEAQKKEYEDRLRIVNAVLNGYEEQEAELMVLVQQGDLEAKYKLGLYYREKGQKEKALALMNELLSEKESVYAAYGANFIADISFKAGDYPEALELFSKTVKSYKNNDETASEALYKIAFCYNKLGKTEPALKIISSLKQKYPSSEWTKKAAGLEKRIKSE